MSALAATGHRPDKVFTRDHYTEESFQKLVSFAESELENLVAPQHFDLVISGMALGWDQAIAQAAINLGIPVTGAIPCRAHSSNWPAPARERYDRILGQLTDVVLVTDAPYSGYLMEVRNRWMVDRADHVLALYDGTRGGTQNCVRYAEENGVIVTNCWDRWAELRDTWLDQNRGVI